MEITLIESLLEVFKIGLALLGAIFTWENLKDVAPFIAVIAALYLVGMILGTVAEMVRSFFSTGIGRLVVLIGLGVVTANVWIF